MTKAIKKRLAGHVTRSRLRTKPHPLYDCIRKHGAEAMSAFVLAEVMGLKEAQNTEVLAIAATPANCKLNISRGGEYDGLDGPSIFWEWVRADSERYEAYVAKHRAAGLRRPRELIMKMVAAAQDWAAAQPKTAKRRWPQYGRTRMPTSDTAWWETQAGVALKAEMGRVITQERWDKMSAERRTEIGDKISATKKRRFAAGTEEDRQKQRDSAANARKSIDHTYRKERQLIAIKAYWEKKHEKKSL